MAHRILNFGVDYGQPGVVAPLNYPNALAATAVTANQGYFARFFLSSPLTIDTISVYVTTGSAPTTINMDVAIYNDLLTTRIVSSGATASALVTNLVQDTGFTATVLSAGTAYYAAFACDSALPSLGMATWPGTAGSTLFGAGAPHAAALTRAASYPLPADASSATVAAAVPIMGVKT